METLINTKNIPAAQSVYRLHPVDILLSAGQCYRFKETQQPVNIKCEKGLLWITRPNDPRDHLVYAGETYTLNENEQALAQGLTETRFKLVLN
jgi:hypothetical protein